MKRNSNLLNEVLGDVKAVRETAIAAAMSRLQETFEPTVRSLISQKISEEEELPDDDLEVTNMPESNEPIDLDSMEDDYDLDEMTDLDSMEDDYDLDEVLRELESEFEDDDELDAAPTPAPAPAPAPTPAPAPVEAPADPIPDIDDEIDNELDEIISELESELMGNSMEDDDIEAELDTVKSELNETRKVVAIQKKLINELNLLNSKLLYLTKINESYKVSSGQKYKMLGLFDKAHSVREVKLVYAAICETLERKTNINKGVAPRNRSMRESASRPTRSVNENTQNTGTYDFVPRWKKLAGI